jgi:hypothetical protein
MNMQVNSTSLWLGSEPSIKSLLAFCRSGLVRGEMKQSWKDHAMAVLMEHLGRGGWTASNRRAHLKLHSDIHSFAGTSFEGLAWVMPLGRKHKVDFCWLNQLYRLADHEERDSFSHTQEAGRASVPQNSDEQELDRPGLGQVQTLRSQELEDTVGNRGPGSRN